MTESTEPVFTLAVQPVFWLLYTMVIYQLCVGATRRFRIPLFFHPVILSLGLIIITVEFTGTDYNDYMLGGQYLSFLLGPATVALAVPLYAHRERIRRNWMPLLVACLAGGITAALSAVILGMLAGLDDMTLLSLAPKSVTSPIAIGVAEALGGYGSLAAGLVLITGAIGCGLAPTVFRLLKIEDEAAQGFALGVSAHGFGTAFAFSYSQVAGAFAGLAMGLCGLLTAFLLPPLMALLGISS